MLISKNINKFGIFGDNERNRTACLQHIRRYIHSVAWKELDFVRYDTNYKTIYFSKRNPGFTSLIAECKARGWTFDIIQTHCDRGYFWIWSRSEAVRQHIKQHIERDLERNWLHRYIAILDSRVSLLFGRPSNDKHPDRASRSYCDFWKMFGFDSKGQCPYFTNSEGDTFPFFYNYLAGDSGRGHAVCVAVNVKNYQNAKDAVCALDDIEDKIKRAQIENVEEINISFNRYRSILHHVFADDVHYSIRYDGDGERIYVKHDGDGRFEEFKAMIYEMVANTVVVNGFSDFREINILQRLLMERIGNDNVRFVGIANNGDDDTYSLTVYDDRIGSDDGFRNMVEAEIEDIRLSWIEHMELDQDTLRMVVGQNGDHLNAMLEWSGLQDIDKSLVQASWGSGKMYFGIHREDGRLQQVKALIHHLVDHRVEIALNAKEYQYLMKNRQWNLKCIQHDFPKCCLLINTLTADKMFFYGTDKVKLQIMDRIKSLENP